MKIFKKILVGVFGAVILAIMLTGQVLAATLQVTSIGTESVAGGTPGEESYVGTNPTIVGTASSEAEVDITIDDLTTTVVADIDGDWSYTPTGLIAGVYDIEISSNLETLTFTLTISEDSTAETTGKGGATESSEAALPEELLQSGSGESMILTLAAGMFLIGLATVMKTGKVAIETDI